MSVRRLALTAALLAAGLSAPALAQTPADSDVPAAIAAPVKAYRDGDLAAAETQLRALAASNPDAEIGRAHV